MPHAFCVESRGAALDGHFTHQTGLHQIAKRLKNPRSPGPLGYRPFPGTWGLRGLPVEFEPADAVAT